MRREVMHMPIGSRILKNCSKDLTGIHLRRVSDDHLDPQRRGSGFDDSDVLRMAIAIHEKCTCFRLRHPLRHGHGLRTGRCLVKKRGVRHLKPRQVTYHGLKIQKSFQTPLTDLWLIRRISRVPRRILENVAQNRRWRDRAMITLSDQRRQNTVFRSDLPQMLQHLALRHGPTEIKRRLLPDRCRYSVVDQRVQTVDPQHVKHLRHLSRRWSYMPPVRKIIR